MTVFGGIYSTTPFYKESETIKGMYKLMQLAAEQ